MLTELYDGEEIAALTALPEDWRNAPVLLAHVPDIEFILLRLRAFYAKMHRIGFEHLADETLEYYIRDWATASYPAFSELRLLADAMDDAPLRLAIMDAAEEIMEKFGYWMPASFYWVLVAPALRPDVREARMLRYSEIDKPNARGWDASLHALLKAADIGLFIQAVNSRHGFLMSHGCDCNHLTTEINASHTTAFDYEFVSDDRLWKQIMAFWWHMWWEYAVFELQPNTLVGSSYAHAARRS